MRQLAALGEPRALPKAVLLLKHPDPRLRIAAAWALGSWGDPDARKPFARRRPVRWRETPGRVGAPAAVEPLIEALADPDRRVRASACYALASIGDLRAANAFLPALKDVMPLSDWLRDLLIAWPDAELVAGVSALATADDLLLIASWGEHQR